MSVNLYKHDEEFVNFVKFYLFNVYLLLRGEESHKPLGCQICHIPYSESSVPFPTNLVRCNVCR